MNNVNIARALEVVAGIRQDSDCLIQGERTLSWREVARRIRNLAGWIHAQEPGHGAKVALYAYNSPAFLEGCMAAFRAGLAPVNVNYRYREEELRYLFEDSDTEIIIVHEDFVSALAQVAPKLAKLRAVAVIGAEESFNDASGLPGAGAYETIVEQDRPAPDVPLSADDPLLIYTGGTTGMPKGVVWRQGDLFELLLTSATKPGPANLAELRDLVIEHNGRQRQLVGPPMMHGTGWASAIGCWLVGGTVILVPDPRAFDASAMLRTIEREAANKLTIVGDSFARPLADELDSGGNDYDISSVRVIVSSGVMWSEEIKRRLLAHNPGMSLIDQLGSSEAPGMAASATRSGDTAATGHFALSSKTGLFDADLEPLDIAPGARGMIGVCGPQPLGYYKDPEKTARTFVTVEGRRYSIPGDWVEVGQDGKSLTLLGRGSGCINTGGEKVFPEEVEEVLKRLPDIDDAVVLGVPDEKWGEAITAIVSSHSGSFDELEAKKHVKSTLAGYKCPKHFVHVDRVYRSPSGKADYKKARRLVLEELEIEE